MYVVGITGGLASGKSTVSRLLQKQGARIWDADVFAKQVLTPSHEVYHQLVDLLGKSILSQDHDPITSLPLLDRSQLASQMFHNVSLRRQVEGIMHPVLWLLFVKEMEQWRQQGGKLAFWEGTLLVETGRYKILSGLVVVDVPELVQWDRALQRGMQAQDVTQRIHAQQTRLERLKHATWVIENGGSLEQTEIQVLRLWHTLTLQATESLC